MKFRQRDSEAKRSKKAGLPPGTIVHVGNQKKKPVSMSVFIYDEKDIQEITCKKVEEIPSFEGKKIWVNVDGVHDVGIIEQVGQRFELHPLLLEDVSNTNQRSKVDEFDKALFVVMQMMREENGEILFEQVSLVLGKDFLISFQEDAGDVFDTIRQRLRTDAGKIRKREVDYLFYSLVDSIIDKYFAIVEHLGEKVETIEEIIEQSNFRKTMAAFGTLRKDLIFLRKAIWPIRETMSALLRNESGLMQDSTFLYLRDAYDHVVHVLDSTEAYRDLLSGLLETHISLMSHRLNEVMKVLTVITTIFIPLTFITSIYGMNFKHMPELEWVYAYPVLMTLILLAGGIMFLMMRKRKWL